MKSTIADDLRKLANNINAKKIISVGEKFENEINPEIKPEIRSAPNTTFDITIDSIIERIKPPFMPVADSTGYIHDTVTIAVKCDANHIHKYFITDIMKFGLTIKNQCKTCGAGNKFQQNVRNTAEKILSAPFVIDTESTEIQFINPVLKIKLQCLRGSHLDFASIEDSFTVIKFHQTSSKKRITETLRKYIPPTADSEIVPPKIRKRQKESLPITSALAETTTGIITPAKKINDSDQLCIENCTNFNF